MWILPSYAGNRKNLLITGFLVTEQSHNHTKQSTAFGIHITVFAQH